jgi:N-acetylneuraminate synthase
VKTIKIGNRGIGRGNKPFVIAEMSGNHNQSLDRALEIIEAAAQSGADAVKIQTYTADTMTLDLNTDAYTINDSKSLWDGKSLYELYQEAHTPWDWHKPIFDRCRELGILAFSTPFDESAIDFLEELDVPCYKIASFENTDIALIKRAAATGKPIIVSTGMATEEEIEDIVAAVNGAGNPNLILLKCTSSYPASPENTNILTIPDMQNRFKCQIGLSDHTMGIGVALASVALGATVIEKHFTLARADGGVDSVFSIEPHELKSLVEESEKAWQSLGEVSYGATKSEANSTWFRRSIFITEDLKKGDILTESNTKRLRPAVGVAAKHYEGVLGKAVTSDVARGTALAWEMLE